MGCRSLLRRESVFECSGCSAGAPRRMAKRSNSTPKYHTLGSSPACTRCRYHTLCANKTGITGGVTPRSRQRLVSPLLSKGGWRVVIKPFIERKL